MPYIYEAGKYDPLAAYQHNRAEAMGRRGRKLTLTDQCQIFSLSKTRFSQMIIAKMYGVSEAAVSHIANCFRTYPAGRYRAVCDEWKRLGEEEFIRTYLIEDVFAKAIRLAQEIPNPLDDASQYANSAPNPHADRWASKNIGTVQVGNEGYAEIVWAPSPAEISEERRGPDGWRVAWYWEGELQPIEPQWNEDAVDMPWRTSGEAYDWLFESRDLKSPRRAGRPRKIRHMPIDKDHT